MKKLKLLFGRFIRSIVNEVITSRIKEILDAGTRKQKELALVITELDTFGGLMGRKEFIKKLKHAIKLVDLRKKWIDASIYKRKGLSKVEELIELEKEITDLYHKAKREGDKKEIARAEGRLEVIYWIKEDE